VANKENVWKHLTMCNEINPYFDAKTVLSKEEGKVFNVFYCKTCFRNKFIYISMMGVGGL
jgi:hypothetical protein